MTVNKMDLQSDMATRQPHEDVMTLKFPAGNRLFVLLAAPPVVVVGLDVTQASAQTTQKLDKNGRPYYGPTGPNSSYQQGPHTRIYVTKRSWLDAGVEGLPADRQLHDYAFPPD